MVPANQIPSFRSSIAVQNKVEKNILIKTWGGLGDQICAEPTLAFALRTFKGCTISLASEQPELFHHLPFHEVFHLKKVQPLWDRYLVFDTIHPVGHLTWDFMSHMLVNCVDYPSLCAFRCQLPTAEREVNLVPSPVDEDSVDVRLTHEQWDRAVVVHAGRHWQSKTFPKPWWDEVLTVLKAGGAIPILLGGDTDDNRGTVDVDASGCVDLRNKLIIMESVALLQRARVLLTNDSAPLHMAVSGDAWVGFVATCKHPDYIMHWRRKQWGWRMKNFGRGGVWDIVSYCPNVNQEISAENVGDENLKRWLPEPGEFARWALERLQGAVD